MTSKQTTLFDRLPTAFTVVVRPTGATVASKRARFTYNVNHCGQPLFALTNNEYRTFETLKREGHLLILSTFNAGETAVSVFTKRIQLEA